MKIKSNVRAGAGSNSKSTSVGGHSSQANNTVAFYVPPVSRCVGI
jgi:hypothetical protein